MRGGSSCLARVLFCRDLFDRVIKEAYNDGTEYHYFYDTEGNLSRQCCVENGNVTAVYVFEYDSLGRLIRSKQTSDGSLQVNDDEEIVTVDEGTTVQRTEHLYDNENRITSQSWQLGSRTYSESYTYNDDVASNTGSIKDGSLATMKIDPLNKTLSFTYDSLKHLSKVTVPGIYARNYTYRGLTSTRSTNQISRIDYTQNGNTNFSRLYYDYTYDDAGNITTVKQNGSQIAKYEYDEQGQLIEETRAGGTYRYTYDTAGNILDVTVSGIYNNYKAFTYSTGAWKDLLTTIKIGTTTKSISYDASGNPKNWFNGNTLTNLEWSKGRQLTKLNKDSTVIEYAYDMSGIRSSKKVGSDTYHYITQNGQVVRQTWGSKILDIVYDNNGQPFALCYSTNGGSTFTDYYYITNVQGDVVRLVNSAGTTVANYTYDAWGKVLSVTNASGATITDTNNIANINPIRYRGYYYDTETGWYYLQSRYYDPEIGRFINADNRLDVDTFIGGNLFAYCENNPVDSNDPDGYDRKRIRVMQKKSRRLTACALNKTYSNPSKKANAEKSSFRKLLEAISSKKEDGNTFSVGLSIGNTAGGVGGARSYVISADTSYNYARQVTNTHQTSTGEGASAALVFTYTNAKDVYELNGESLSYGGTIAGPLGISVDLITFSPAPGEKRWGISIGISAGFEAEYHGGESFTETIGSSNPIESLIDSIYG